MSQLEWRHLGKLLAAWLKEEVSTEDIAPSLAYRLSPVTFSCTA